MPATAISCSGSSLMSTKTKSFLNNKEIAANRTSYNRQANGQCYTYNGSICEKNKLCIKKLQLAQAFPCYHYIIKSISVSIASTRKNTYFSINHDLRQDVVILANFFTSNPVEFQMLFIF